MTFTSPAALLGLMLVPVLAAVYVWRLKRRRRYAVRHSNVPLLRLSAGEGPGMRRHIPAAFYLLAIAAMVIALARPQATLATPESSGTVNLALDISGSMSANDVKPSRIEAAKAVVRDFVNKQPKGVKIGLVAFSASALLVMPPTED